MQELPMKERPVLNPLWTSPPTAAVSPSFLLDTPNNPRPPRLTDSPAPMLDSLPATPTVLSGSLPAATEQTALQPMSSTPQPPPPSAALPCEPNGNAHVNGDAQPRKATPTASTPESSPAPIRPNHANSHRTLAAYLAKNPKHSVGQAERRLFPPPNPLSRLAHRFAVKHSVIDGISDKDMPFWEAKGPELRERAGWKLAGTEGPGVEVSELFWKMYLSLMPTLVRDPMAGMCAPDLLGSTTTMPLSIISLIPDIMQHYRAVIVRAKHEVFLVTNYWQPSDSVQTIRGALVELSKRVVKDNRDKVIVKLMYDRGSWEQLWNAHAPVATKEWAPLDLPLPDEIPGIQLEVVNFHRVLLGTFHCKFLIVDRKVVLLNSNNIQDRPNLEMMSHFEGPIVDSFYEIALHSWHNKLEPMLPCINKPYSAPRDPKTGEERYLFSDRNPYLADIEVVQAARAARKLLRRQTQDELRRTSVDHSVHPARDRLVEAVRQVMANQRQNLEKKQDEFAQRSAHAMKELRDFGERFGISSRPGSRRTSATDLTKLADPSYHDSETAAITAENQRITRLGHQSVPHSAPTSPSLTGIPLRTKTSFPPHARFSPGPGTDEESRQSLSLATDEANLHRDIPELSLHSGESSTIVGSAKDHYHINGKHGPDGQEPKATKHSSSPRVTPMDAQADGAIVTIPENLEPSNEPLPIPGEHHVSWFTKKRHLYSGTSHDDAHGTGPGRSQSMPVRSGAASIRSIASYADASGANTPVYRPRVSVDEPIPPGRGTKRLFKLSKRFNAGATTETWATVEDNDELDDFRPHVLHAPHDPFPIALVSRRPHGMPGHQDIRNPQNAALLAGFRYAQKSVFIQTPTLNARPIVRAVKQACRRGVQVTLFLDLGFNDMGESIPFQGGTNEQVVDRLYKVLIPEGKNEFLKVHWYTSKDQIRPLNAIKKQRNCHIKFAGFDDQVMIWGNANLDTQSIFHSSEVNAMIYSPQVVKETVEKLISNQNTMKYGGVDPDGVWRDVEGKTLNDYGVTGGGGFMSGMKAIARFAKTAAAKKG